MGSFFKEAKHIFTGYTAGKAQEDEFQSRTILFVASLAGPTAMTFSVVNYLHGHMVLSVMLLVAFVMLIPCFKLISNHKYLVFTRNLLMLDAVVIFTALFIDGGIAGIAFTWSLIVPFLACLLVGLPKAWYWITVYFFILVALVIAHMLQVITLPYSDGVLAYFFAAFLFFSFVAAAFEAQFERLHIRHEESIAKLQELQSNLEQKVEHRSEALQELNESLTEEVTLHQETTQALQNSEIQIYEMQKMETIGTLVGGIAHDFNNMLAGINANIFMIKQRVTEDEDLLKRTQNVESLVKSASDMVRQLLTFARKDNVEFQNFDLVEHMNESYKLLQVAISEHVNMNLSNYDGKLPVYASQTQIQQVIMNMVNNARDATAELDKPIIQIMVEANEIDNKFFALISIADNGLGIPEAELEKIFEPFFTTKEVGKGTGLGLAMSFGAIQSHGGSIEVSSIQGKGTVFKIYLPLSADQEISPHVETITQGNISGHETILLADDDQRLRESQKDVLESLGYHIFEAENGKEAVSLYAEKKDDIDLVVLDLTMPVMGGVQAAKKIRELSSDVKVLFITGYDMDSTINGGDALEPRERVLEKPFTMKSFHHQIRECLMK